MGVIGRSWKSILNNIDFDEPWAKYAGPGSLNDPDMCATLCSASIHRRIVHRWLLELHCVPRVHYNLCLCLYVRRLQVGNGMSYEQDLSHFTMVCHAL